jgi:hypothetical protein
MLTGYASVHLAVSPSWHRLYGGPLANTYGSPLRLRDEVRPYKLDPGSTHDSGITWQTFATLRVRLHKIY